MLVGKINKVFDRILRDFDLSFVVEELPNLRRDALRRKMKAFVRDAKAEIDKNIEIELAKAESESDR